MSVDVPLQFRPERPAPDFPGQHPLADLRPRIRRAADSARRAGPDAARFLRRSITVYADDAWGNHVPEDSFIRVVHQEMLDVLQSRMSMSRLTQLMDAAAEGIVDGYSRHEKVVEREVATDG